MTKPKYRTAAQGVVLNKGQLTKEEIGFGCWVKADTSGHNQWWGGELGRGGRRRGNAIVWSEYRLLRGTESFDLLPAPGMPLRAQKHPSCTGSLNKLRLLIKLLIRHLIWVLAFRTLIFFVHVFFPILEDFKSYISSKTSLDHSSSSISPLRCTSLTTSCLSRNREVIIITLSSWRISLCVSSQRQGTEGWRWAFLLIWIYFDFADGWVFGQLIHLGWDFPINIAWGRL